MSHDLQVLSLNCWGLAVISKNRKFRIEAIAKVLSSCSYDIVTLQEVWVQKDYQYILDSVKQNLPFAKYFYSGALGSGLAILSKYPIVSTTYHRYALNGKPLKIFHGDYYVGKGCGTALVKHPDLGFLEIFNTHLHAGYGPKDPYKAHRASQCWQLAHLLRQSAAMGRQIIICGDFNSMPSSFNYKLIQQHGFMTDSWLQVHGEPDINKFNTEHITAESYSQLFGFTCNSPFNTFSRYYKDQKENIQKRMGKRLDYIFYRETQQLSCIDSQVVLVEKINDMSYSDHFGVVSIFKVYPRKESLETHHLLGDPGYTHLEPKTVCEILNALELNRVKAKRDANRLLRWMCVGILIVGCLYAMVVAIPTLLPHPLVIILMTVFGFVFGSTEQGALTEFIQEIETFKTYSNIMHHDTMISIP
ncbi:Endonuclease/exonuclease/phosphatase, partial [Pilaira anomala]